LKTGSLKFLIAGALVTAAIMYLVVSGMRDPGAIAAYYEVSEIQSALHLHPGSDIKVNGRVVDGSIKWDPASRELRFHLADTRSADRILPVICSSASPAVLSDGAQVVVQGRMEADGTFRAESLLTRCPSRYEKKADQ